MTSEQNHFVTHRTASRTVSLFGLGLLGALGLLACGGAPTDGATDGTGDVTPSSTLVSGTVTVPANGGSEPTSADPSTATGAPGSSSNGSEQSAPRADGAPTATPAAVSAARAVLAKLGLPARFAIGLGNDAYGSGDPNQVASYALGTKLDLHYMYLSGLDWPSWTPTPGDYVKQHAESARAHGVVPMFTLYQAAAWGEAKLSNFNDAAYMAQYWRGARTMFEKLGAFGDPAVVHLEPDLWGYTQQQGGDDPSRVPMKVGSLVPECTDLPENVAGFGKCLVRLSRTLSPKVVVGLSASTFGATTNGASDPARVGAYLAKIGGADADITVVETLDRDAGCFEAGVDPVCKRSGQFYWDETNTAHPNFHDHLAWAKTVGEATGKPLLWWQMPLGVPSGSAGSSLHYRDNRVKYLFAHPEEFVAAGGIGAVFGTGAQNQTTAVSDGGQFKSAVASYAANPAAL